jgi:hypothetical protein
MLRWIWRDYPGVIDSDENMITKAAAVKPIQLDLFPGYNPKNQVNPTGKWTWERRFRGNSTQYT